MATNGAGDWKMVRVGLVAPVVVGVCVAVCAYVCAWVAWGFALALMGNGAWGPPTPVSLGPPAVVGTIFTAFGLAVALLSSVIIERKWLRTSVRANPEFRSLLRWKQIALAAMLVSAAWVVPPLVEALRVAPAAYGARAAGRLQAPAIIELGRIGTPEACESLLGLIDDARQTPVMRGTALVAAVRCPKRTDVALRIAGAGEPALRAAAGAALRDTKDDDRVRAARARLAGDPDTYVREASGRGWNPGRFEPDAAHIARLEEQLREGAPSWILGAAAELLSGYEPTLQIFMDSTQPDDTRLYALSVMGRLRDDRALPMLEQIVTMRASAGLVPSATEHEYRKVAAEAILTIAGARPDLDDVGIAYKAERQADRVAQFVLQRQAAFVKETSVFADGFECLLNTLECSPALLRRRLTALGSAEVKTPGYRASLAGNGATYVYIAVPEQRYRTGIASVCADDTGRICMARDGRTPRVADGRCLVTGAMLPDDLESLDWMRRRDVCRVVDAPKDRQKGQADNNVGPP